MQPADRYIESKQTELETENKYSPYSPKPPMSTLMA